MKKFLRLVLAIVFTVTLTACNGDDSGSGTGTAEAEESSQPQSSENAEERDEKATEDSNDVTEIGKVSDPIPLGETATFDTGYYDEGHEAIPANISITFSNVLRGEEAYNQLLEANQFNKAAPEGHEWALFDATMTMNEGDKDVPMYVMAVFTPVSSDGEEVPQDSFASIPTSESFGLKNVNLGETHSGKVALLVPEGDGTVIKYTGNDYSTIAYFGLE